jgi:hypothetical protein
MGDNAIQGLEVKPGQLFQFVGDGRYTYPSLLIALSGKYGVILGLSDSFSSHLRWKALLDGKIELVYEDEIRWIHE